MIYVHIQPLGCIKCVFRQQACDEPVICASLHHVSTRTYVVREILHEHTTQSIWHKQHTHHSAEVLNFRDELSQGN